MTPYQMAVFDAFRIKRASHHIESNPFHPTNPVLVANIWKWRSNVDAVKVAMRLRQKYRQSGKPILFCHALTFQMMDL